MYKNDPQCNAPLSEDNPPQPIKILKIPPPPPPLLIYDQHRLLDSYMRGFILYHMKVYLLHFFIIISPHIYTYWCESFLLGISWIWWIWWWISAFLWHWCLPICFLLNGRLPATTRHIQCLLLVVQLTVFHNNNERNKLLKSLVLLFIALQ